MFRRGGVDLARSVRPRLHALKPRRRAVYARSMSITRFAVATLSLLLLASITIAAPQRWSQELPLSDTRLVAQRASGASVASNGDLHVAVWTRGSDVVGVRIDAGGNLIDQIPFVASEDEDPTLLSARVVWNGHRFLIIWAAGGAINARSMAIDGTLSEPFTVRLTSGPVPILAASNGETTLVATVYGEAALIGRDGSVRHFDLPEAPHRVTSIASDGRDYLVAVRADIVSLVRVDGDDGDAKVSSRLFDMGVAELVASDSGYFLIGATGHLVAHPIDAAGRVAGSPLIIAENVGTHARVSGLSLRGGAVLLSWLVPRGSGPEGELMLTRIDGMSVEATASAGVTAHSSTLSGDGALPLVFWTRGALQHAGVDAALALHHPRLTSLGGAEQKFPAVAATRAGWFTAWVEDGTSIRAAVFAPQLARMATLVVATDVHTSTTSPAIAAHEDVVLVSWVARATQGYRLFSRRFTPEGEPIDRDPLEIAHEGAIHSDSAAVWNGRYFVVAYSTFVDGAFELRVSRVTHDGVVLDHGGKRVAVTQRGGDQQRPALATSQDVTLLVWQDGEPAYDCRVTCPPPPPAPRVEAIRLSLDADPLDPVQTVISTQDAVAPAVAAGDGVFLIGWRTAATIVTRIALASDIGSGVARAIADAAWESEPRLSAAARPGGFFLAWNGRTIEAAILDHNGMALNRQQLAVAAEGGSPSSTIHVATRGHDLAVVYTRRSDAAGDALRGYLRGYRAPEPRRRSARSR